MDVKLVLLKKNGAHKFLSLPSSVTVIGRRHSCDLCIPLMPVSRKHCQINSDDDVLRIRDLNSHNGTYLNGKRIKDEAVVQAGDSIRIGPLTFVFQVNGRPQTITVPDLAAQSSPAENIADKQLDDFPELDNLDSLEQTSSA